MGLPTNEASMKFAQIGCILAALLLSACSRTCPEKPPAVAVQEQELLPMFSDITKESGIDFTHFNAATQEKLLPETMGSGVAFFDFDGDGLPDIYLVNGAPLYGPNPDRPTGRLYRNLGNGSFEDVTAGSGLEESFFGMGVAIGDFDNDGRIDLALTATDHARIYRNLGGGKFADVTREMRLRSPGYGASIAFLDYDRDGYLDLFVSRYVVWSRETDIPCRPDGVHQIYCTPEMYPAISNMLFKNIEGKYFKDVSKESGISRYLGKALGIVVLDYNNNGWPDIAVANDTVRNFLFENQGDGTFREIGEVSGMAYSESGAARGGMGIDAGDLDRDGRVDIVIGNFSQEMVAVFRGMETGYFIDDAAQVGIGIPTLMTLAFGTLVEDFCNDGWLDLLVVNGHIEPEISRLKQYQQFRQPPQLFMNRGDGHFDTANSENDPFLSGSFVARGLAVADIDLDGDLDLILSQNGDKAVLFRNNSRGNNWLQIQLVGTQSNWMGFGARVEVTTERETFARFLNSGRSYMSACEPVLNYGLGKATTIEKIEVSWPSGIRQVIRGVEINQRIVIQESEHGET
jgi:enediyne biosynthesis protein E4